MANVEMRSEFEGEDLEEAVEDDFDFDEEEDDFLERSQRKLLQAKRERRPRRDEW
ncbi:MAG TPA: hypothetical protein V6D47_14125 [Oscillatoriaceae cyanobacterium]